MATISFKRFYDVELLLGLAIAVHSFLRLTIISMRRDLADSNLFNRSGAESAEEIFWVCSGICIVVERSLVPSLS